MDELKIVGVGSISTILASGKLSRVSGAGGVNEKPK
jgi:hypothetical protein